MNQKNRKPAVFSGLRTAMEAAELVRYGAARGFSVTFFPDSACVNASRGESFICTAAYNAVQENMAQVREFIDRRQSAEKVGT